MPTTSGALALEFVLRYRAEVLHQTLEVRHFRGQFFRAEGLLLRKADFKICILNKINTIDRFTCLYANKLKLVLAGKQDPAVN